MNRSKWIPLAVLLLLQAADALTTHLALRLPQVIEWNTIVASNGLWSVKTYAAALVLVLVWYRWQKPYVWHLWALCGVYVLIVANNLACWEIAR